jgi:MerR family redox-sensitive transcriptional activator SoxR
MTNMTIGEIADLAGVRPSTIRYYESIGLLTPPTRVHGQRRYEPGVLPILRVIQAAQHAGFSISEIQTLLHDFPDDTPASVRWQTLASKKLGEVEALIEQANTMKRFLEQALQCQCVKLEECFRAANECGSDQQ